MPKRTPASFSKYFWDIDFKTLNPSKHSLFIIKRVLDRGDSSSLKWLLKNYSKKKIKKVILTSKDLSPQTANFWADVYKLNKSQIVCLQKPYSPIPFGLSS